MATSELDSDVFRRRFQKKLADHFADELETDLSNFEKNIQEKDGQATVRKSPFCLQNILWLGTAVAVFYFSDFVNVLVYDLRIQSAWFWIGVLSIGLHLCIAVFLVFWLTLWKNVSTDEWETRYPSAVPVATASLVLGIICLCVGLWPVWGFLTPVILLVLLMGTVVVVAMVG
ncbi:unnamed protein product [Candidula unifasciata]|uniref:Transmembrane protein 128 n=1 Tax=Candidula unifasciata TaxID=100452 RepID=A0A8S3Z0I1_9EUPU|nr:unnamed protein product [Candidula unifasciata]